MDLNRAKHKWVWPIAGLLLGAPLPWSCGDPSPLVDGLERRRPLTPLEALESFQIAEGFRLDLVASEPQVADPIAITFDEDGKLYVAEMRGYPFDPPPGGGLEGRIRLLEDNDGDGVFESSRVFADGLHWPSGIACWNGGIFVTAAPDILYLKDTSGDGVADIRRTVFTGFGTAKSEDIVNNLKWGMDNWIYGTTSYNGGTVRHPERSADHGVPLGSNDFRFHPVTEVFEAVEGTRGDFGNAFDEWGNRFSSNSGNPVIHAVFPLRHVVEGMEPPQLSASIYESDRLVYPISEPEPWRMARKSYWSRWVDTTRDMRAQRFPPRELAFQGYLTGGAGLGIYRGTVFPPEFRGNAFTPEPAGNLVLRTVLEPQGVTFRARRATVDREFLASTDNWFRPVNFANAPDGCLYMVDMYREVIEDPSAIPGEILEHIDYYTGQAMGRIYRIAPAEFLPMPPPRLGKASPSELVGALNHENGWWRSTAQRLLVERQAVEVAPALKALLAHSDSPHGRLHALWSLDGLGQLDEGALLAALDDAHPALRQAAVRLSEAQFRHSSRLRAKVSSLASDQDAAVRFRVALAGSAMEGNSKASILASILRRDPSDPWIRAAVFSGTGQNSAALLSILLKDDAFITDQDSPGAVRDLAEHIARARADEEMHAMLRLARGVPGRMGLQFRMSVVAGIVAGLDSIGSSLQSMQEIKADQDVWLEIESVLAEVPSVALSKDAVTVTERVEAIRLMAWVPTAAVLRPLGTLLSPEEPTEIQLAAVRALGSHRGPEVGRILAESWRGYSPAVRREAVEALFSREERTDPFLDALADGTILIAQLDPARLAELADHPNRAIRRRAAGILSNVTPLRPQAVIREYRAAITTRGDAARGAEVFDRECATCHRLGGRGHEVGPDLRERAASSREELLVDILEPNQSVQSNYVNYRLDTSDGLVLTGILARESPVSVTLRRGEGIEDVVARSDISSLRSMGLSLMPEGLEDEIDQSEMADLLQFVQSEARQ